MLSSLRITNLALVEDLALDLGPGFSVLTGETGAGKSLLVDALALLVGARADADTVRLGAERATVEAVVEGRGGAWLDFLGARGLPAEHPVVLRREVSAAGRSRAWINGASCALNDLKEAGRIWMRLSSQHDHQSLLAEERHLALLDEVLGIEPDLSDLVSGVRAAAAALDARNRSEADRARRLAELAELIGDLEKLAPKPAEWSALKAERETLRHSALLEATHREAAEALHASLPGLREAGHALARAATVLPEAQDLVDRLRSAGLELEDLQALAQDQAQRFARRGEGALDDLEGRLARFEKLARRHRCEPDELAGVLAELRAEEARLKDRGESPEALAKALERACGAYLEAAEVLHARRSEALAPLEADAKKRLARLGMKGARLQCRLAVAEEATSPVIRGGRGVRVAASGFSTVALWIEPNVGEGWRPLAKVASGGELSRVMLALLGAGLRGDGRASALTLVLDEVDAGIGGETALAVGDAIQELGRVHQVLCVTHLAQVAGRADRHGALSKATAGDRTHSRFAWVEGETRIRELARLLSGQPDRPEALEHARVLIGAN
jgi:DNA repair protein RecN (Recombination protein N)